jgi:hypothetical protein
LAFHAPEFFDRIVLPAVALFPVTVKMDMQMQNPPIIGFIQHILAEAEALSPILPSKTPKAALTALLLTIQCLPFILLQS